MAEENLNNQESEAENVEQENVQQEPEAEDLAEQLKAAKAEAEKWRTFSRDWEKKAKANNMYLRCQ